MGRFQSTLASLASANCTILQPNGGGSLKPLSSSTFFHDASASDLHVFMDPSDLYSAPENLWRDMSELSPSGAVQFYHIDFPVQSRYPRLKQLTYVVEVDFFQSRFRGDSFAGAIKVLPHLRSLQLVFCEYDSDCLAALSNATELEFLTLTECSIRPDVVASIVGRNLRSLELSEILGQGNKIELSDKDFLAISKMDRLEVLKVTSWSGKGSPASGLQHLKRCKYLKSMIVDLEHMSKSELANLKREMVAALPNCEIDLYSVSKR